MSSGIIDNHPWKMGKIKSRMVLDDTVRGAS